jgi:ABC-type sulfate transport system permease subunit
VWRIWWGWDWGVILCRRKLCGGYGGVGIGVSYSVEGSSVENMVGLGLGCHAV